MTNTMLSVGQKLGRVDEHLDTLSEGFDDFLNEKPYVHIGKLQPDGRSILYTVKEVRKPFPDHLLPIIGEVLYHLRSSLDYIALGMAVACGANEGKVQQQTQFPITTNYRAYCEAVANGNLPRFSDDALRAIERLQPYNRWEGGSRSFPHPLRQLRDLSNIDKHRRPVVAVSAISGMFHADPPGLDCNFERFFDEPLEVGAKMGLFVCDKPLDPKMDVEADFFFRITFKDVRVLGPGGLVEELRRITLFIVSEVIPTVAPWFLPDFLL